MLLDLQSVFNKLDDEMTYFCDVIKKKLVKNSKSKNEFQSYRPWERLLYYF